MVYTSKQSMALTVFVFSLLLFTSNHAQYDLKISNNRGDWIECIIDNGESIHVEQGEVRYVKVYNSVSLFTSFHALQQISGKNVNLPKVEIPWHGELLLSDHPDDTRIIVYDFQHRSDYYPNNNSYQQEYEEDDGIGLEMIMYIGIIIVGLVALLQ